MGAYRAPLLTAKFKALVPTNIHTLMAQTYMEETMRRMRRGELAMTREDIRVVAAET